MGMGQFLLCGDCGHEFFATEAFNCGMVGEVSTPVVCPEHGLGSASVGVNLLEGGEIGPLVSARPTFPCSTCGKESPRWDEIACPKCAGNQLQNNGIVCSD